jgi:catalase
VGIATTVQEYIDQLQDNNTPGIIFARNNPNFGDDFMAAITQKRFWDRAIYEQPSLAGQLS